MTWLISIELQHSTCHHPPGPTKVDFGRDGPAWMLPAIGTQLLQWRSDEVSADQNPPLIRYILRPSNSLLCRPLSDFSWPRSSPFCESVQSGLDHPGFLVWACSLVSKGPLLCYQGATRDGDSIPTLPLSTTRDALPNVVIALIWLIVLLLYRAVWCKSMPV